MNTALNLLLVKLFHTLIWLFFVAVIFYVLYCGVANRITTYNKLIFTIVYVIGLIVIAYRLWHRG